MHTALLVAVRSRKVVFEPGQHVVGVQNRGFPDLNKPFFTKEQDVGVRFEENQKVAVER